MASDKTIILVTGGNGGIGYETVLALAAASPEHHILLASRSLEKGEKALQDINTALGDSSPHGTISVVKLDVTSQEDIAALKTHITETYGILDVLINNAGIIVYQDVPAITSMRQTFEANVFGPALVTEALEPLLKESKTPLLIYVSSSQGSITRRLDPTAEHRHVRGDHYRMSKSALNMLAACHRYNYAEWGCKVLAFCPGWCISNLTGEKGREMRKKGGARDPNEPANALVEIVLGKRDADIGKNGLVSVDGGVLPW
ncbi:putative short chain dehydrogenase/reductase [Xylariaceae sp. FL0255]|nr:putative short chain dehydrogenase/reductase [Xylariaceae sp. FL0255]